MKKIFNLYKILYNDYGDSMKVLHIGKKGNVEKYTNNLDGIELIDVPMDTPVDKIIQVGKDAKYIIADAIATIPRELVENMPNLKMVHSEGVAYNKFDVDACSKNNVMVCNCAGCNASAVAENTLFLMKAVLLDVFNNMDEIKKGNQIQVKEAYMKNGSLKEIADMTIGLIGLGSIGQAVAKLCNAYGAKVYYTKRNRYSKEIEQQLNVEYLELNDLLLRCDMISLHCPVYEQTTNMCDDSFFSKMKDGSYFINTSRGELVNDEALIQALQSGKVKMAGLDTLDHEPVQSNHPVLTSDVLDKIVLTPHIGGITASSFSRAYAMIWQDIQTIEKNEIPQRCINKQ